MDELRGFGFITYVDPSVVDTVIAETHNINDKQVEIKRTIPKGSAESKSFRTEKVFVGGIPTTMDEDEFKGFFSKCGKVTDCEIIRDHVSKWSRGFGFIEYDEEQVVDNLLSQGNMIDMLGNQVEIKKVELKKPSHPGPSYSSESRGRAYNDSYDGGFGDSYNNFGSGRGFGSTLYRSYRGMSGRFGDYGYGGGEFGGRYGDFGAGEFGSYRGDPSLDYPSRYGSYGGGYGGGAGRYGGGGLIGAYGHGGVDEYGGGGLMGTYGRRCGYGRAGSGAGYESGPDAGYGGPGGLYGSRTSYDGSGRFHPYGR
ncbi:hypothetical protein R3W88_032397 [Solanum pinnatisectum]|uniref:RRM domain-containing protein n=1 Tax=Solanum pinnatisectum TaxID=50273 RepID=A0AAV9LP15_9SOLN|nr:hypothetical protein R3W88_032397 [Solanum pinnatisectum]